MTDHTSPLSQRVRRLLGAGSHATADEVPPQNGRHAATHGHHGQGRPDTGVLFESQIARLGNVLRELHAIDRAREAELRHLRERLAIADAQAQTALVERLAPTIAQLDALIGEAARMLQPAPEPPPAATLFERMRARSAATGQQTSREALLAWASALLDLRTQLAALIDQEGPLRVP